MKKAYSKPLIVFEDFHLSANIAASCANSVHFSPTSCAYTVGNLVLFSAEPVCQTTDLPDGMCYQAPDYGISVFSS